MTARLRNLFLPLLTLLFALTPTMVRATWYSENITNGADIMMMDLRWPWWPSGTYFANWNSGFNPKPNNLSFYAGITSTVPDAPGSLPSQDKGLLAAFRPGNVWTFWGSDAAGTPVCFTDTAPNLFIKNDYGGEGSSGTVGSEGWPFIKSQRWYSMLARVWLPLGETNPSHAFIGRWIKDQEAQRWHLIGVARLPIAATSFTGNSGFIEPLTSEKAVRSLHRRFGYFRKDGRWEKSDTIAIDKTQYVIVNTVPEGDHEYAAIEYAQRPDLLPQRLKGTPLAGDQKHRFTVKQPDQPVLDQPLVANVRAETTGQQIAVSWDVPEQSSPAFGYTIEVFANPACEGTPKLVQTVRNPSAREALVEVALSAPTVRFTLTDVFDQPSTPVILTATHSPSPAPPTTSAATIPGLQYELYHQDAKRQESYFYDRLQQPNESHHWLMLAEMNRGKLFRRGLSRGFDLSVREQRNTGYAINYRGLLRVPRDGLYLFHVQIDGAYRLQLDGTDALVWDGQHGTTEKSVLRYLSAGDHPLAVAYLFDQLPARNFIIQWEGPGLPRQPIAVDALRVTDDGTFPQAQLQASATGDGTGTVTVNITNHGHQINRTILFLGALQLAESSGAELKFHGPLPRGECSLWARVVFDAAQTIDATPITLNVTGPSIDAKWSVQNVGDTHASYGIWPQSDQGIQFFGNGMHTVTQKIRGDFTATCRIDSYNGSQGEPVNHHAWTGLTAREYGERRDWNWGRDFHLVQTAADGLRASADFTDFGAGRISSYALPKARPWLRIVRAGDIWTAWTSTDGKQWELGAYQFKKTNPEMEVGLFFSALPQEARAHYHASVSALTITSGLAPECIPAVPPTATNTAGDRLTGVILAPSDNQVIVVRSSSQGLLRSTNGGQTWAPANGNLPALNSAVRSVAIHPTHPEIMLRAGPSGLWKTGDGGQHWEQLAFPGDFDGQGPSALCGEVLAFDLQDPHKIYAGSESKGCFKSTDDGLTWNLLGLVGERITTVLVWPWEKYYPAAAKGLSQICVITCPDHWMKFLGRGDVPITTASATSRSYVSPDGIKTLTVADERLDTGFYNVVFDKALQTISEMRYATTHGYQSQVFSGQHMALYPAAKQLEWLRPFTGISACAKGDQKFGRVITQALDPLVPGRLSRSDVWAFEWSWLPTKGDIPQGGLISVCGDIKLGEHWWFVFTDGLYSSTDGGITLKKILTESGQASH